MSSKLLVAALSLAVATGAFAQAKKRVDKAADLPRFTYKVEGDLESLVRDEAKFRQFADQVRRDDEAVLAGYDIAEKATERQYLGVLAQVAMLEGRFDDALARAAQVKELQEKPADKLLSGVQLRAIVAAAKKAGNMNSEAYREEVGRLIRAELDKLPYAVIENDIKGFKASAEFIGEALVLGRVREVLQPVATKSGELSSDLAPGIIGARYALVVSLPLKATLVDTYGKYLAANRVEKADIWAARDVALPPGRNYPPVKIAVWDSGVDASLFADRMLKDALGKDLTIAFDKHGRASASELVPLPADLQARLPQMQSRSKGLSDARSNIDSPESAEVKRYLSTLAPDQYKAAIEEISLTGNYQHGTHVAGISMAGNPYARLANGRIEFGHTLVPDPCPSRELAAREAAALAATVDFFKANAIRVVNMSWGGNVRGYEVALEQCNLGKTSEERKAIAREYFDMQVKALKAAFAGAPDILFVTSAGNSADDPTFNESYPSSIVLPNLITVGAVDKAGDEASFTSYGPTVAVHANGYQVVSTVPGGSLVALSGTSMSSPQVTNLAAKILAVNPALKPAEVIAIIRNTAEKSADGRRTLVHPAKAIAAATPK
jgi:subtilisin family serine protease